MNTDAKTEPNDNLLDIEAALTTSQRIVVKPLLDALRKMHQEEHSHLQNVEAVVQEIKRMKLEEQERNKRKEDGLYRAVMQAVSAFFPGRK